MTVACEKSIPPELANGAPAPDAAAPAVVMVLPAEEPAGFQSVIDTVAVELADTEEIISMVIWDRIVAVLSILSRLLPATAARTSASPTVNPIIMTIQAIINSRSENPA